MMDLTNGIALQFERELLFFEQEKQMPYVTSIERDGIKKGLEQGLGQGELIGQIRLYQQLSGQEQQPRDLLLSQTVEALQSQLLELHQSFQSNSKN